MTATSQRGYPKLKQGVRLSGDSDSGPLRLTTTVEAIAEAGDLQLRLPPHVERARFGVGLPVTLNYYREDAAYELKSSIAGIENDLLRLAAPTGIKKSQKRRFPRLKVQLPTRWMRVELSQAFEQSSQARAQQLDVWSKLLEVRGDQARSEAISGSGMRLALSEKLREGEAIYLELELGTLRIRQAGLVLWSGAAESSGEYPLAVGLEFVAVTDEERDDILALVDRL